MSLSAVVEPVNGHHAAKLTTRPLIWREMESATEINRILNHPDVFASISVPGQQPFEVSRFVNDPRFVFLRCDGGVVIFEPDDDPGAGMYQMHTNFLEARRGRDALAVVQAALDWMFTRTGAVLLWTKVPANNPAALGMVRAFRARQWFTQARAWPAADGPCDVTVYSLSLHDWTLFTPTFLDSGRWFHAHLESEFKRLGVAHEEHAEDIAHHRAAGAAVEMFRGGLYAKAILTYNRWARASGYRCIALVSDVPLVIDTGDAVLHIDGDSFKTLRAKEG